MKTSELFRGNHRGLIVKAGLASLAVFFVVAGMALSARAGNGVMSQDDRDGANAGGKWAEFRSEDKMTAARQVRFELLADNYLSASADYKPRIEIVCTNHKYNYADFNPGIPLGPPNRPGIWGQPQIEVMVRVDDAHHYHGWNWIRGRFLSMDKGTTRDLIGAQIFKIQIPGRRGPEIAEFSPAGLDVTRVKEACDLTPKKPGRN